MTEAQTENREHRVAYMMQDGDVTEEQAHQHCDRYPEEYGTRVSPQAVFEQISLWG